MKLIAVDIDGTLLNSQFQVSDANVSALRDAHAQGIHVALATGRRHAFARPIAERLGFDPYLISSNGAVTYTAAGDLISKHLMPRLTALDLLNHMQPYNANVVITFDRPAKGALVVQSRAKISDRIARWIASNDSYIAEIDPIQDALTEDPIQTMFCGTVAEMEAATTHLQSGVIASKVTSLSTQYDHRDLCIVDVLPRGCTKGRALAELAEHLAVSPQDVIAIGDNYNDREMLEFAGLPFVVANAHEELKQNGWAVTRSNDDDGVAYAIESVLHGAAVR